MKKKLVLFVSVVSTFLVGWIYQGTKFERHVNEVLLPLLEDYKENIAYESVVIEKFKFKVTFNKPQLSLKSHSISFISDQLVFRQIPLTNKIYIDSYGAKEKIEVPDNVLYAPNHHISVVVNRPFFEKDLDNLMVNIENQQFSLFNSKADMQLLDLDKYNVSLHHKESGKDNYTLKISSISKNVKLGDAFTEFMSLEFFKLFPHLQIGAHVEKKSTDYYYFLTKLDEMIGGTDGNSDISITYPKAFVNLLHNQNIINSGEEQLTINNALQKDFEINVNNARTNKFANGEFNLKFRNSDHSKIEFKLNQNYDLVQKPEIIELTADYIQKIANRDLNKLFSSEGGPLVFSHDEFIKLLAPFANIHNINFTGLFEYSRAEGLTTHQFKAQVNNYAFEFKGKGDKTHYNSQLSINDFPNLIKFINTYTLEAIQPIVIKVGNQKAFEQFQRVIGTIDKYGLNALKALNNNDELQDQNNFLVKLKRDDTSKTWEINDKGWGEVFADQRIQAFVKSLMPPEESKAD